VIALFWCTIVLVTVVPLAWLTDWGWLLGLTEPAQAKAAGALMVALSCLLAFSLIAVVPRQIMVGRQHGYLAHLLDFVGALLGAIALVAGVYADAPLWVLGVAFTGPSFLLVLLGGLIYLSRARIPLFALRNLKWTVLRPLGRDSLRMAGYQSAYAVSAHSDLFLIGIILGTPASAAYGLAKRIFSLPVIFGETINFAQWPALAKADAAGDRQSVGKVFRWTLFAGSSLALGMAVCLALAYELLIDLWLGRAVPTDAAILYGMVAWVLVATLVNTCDSVLRARNETAFLLRSMVLMAMINLPLTLLLLPVIGPAGAIWGTVAGYALALLLPYLVRLRSLLSRG
jgi:O-antigen/teichoic acid export membrane protein